MCHSVRHIKITSKTSNQGNLIEWIVNKDINGLEFCMVHKVMACLTLLARKSHQVQYCFFPDILCHVQPFPCHVHAARSSHAHPTSSSYGRLGISSSMPCHVQQSGPARSSQVQLAKSVQPLPVRQVQTDDQLCLCSPMTMHVQPWPAMTSQSAMSAIQDCLRHDHSCHFNQLLNSANKPQPKELIHSDAHWHCQANMWPDRPTQPSNLSNASSQANQTAQTNQTSS